MKAIKEVYEEAKAPVEHHAHSGGRFGGDKGLQKHACQHCGQSPMQLVCPGPAQHLHIPLRPPCLIVKRLQPSEADLIDLLQKEASIAYRGTGLVIGKPTAVICGH